MDPMGRCVFVLGWLYLEEEKEDRTKRANL
jgi:hypothetical protein